MFCQGRDKNTENIPLKLVKEATPDKVAPTKSLTGLALGDTQMK
jgi:hypothetical protein